MLEIGVTLLICIVALGLLCVVFYIKIRRSDDPFDHHLHACSRDHCACEKQSPDHKG